MSLAHSTDITRRPFLIEEIRKDFPILSREVHGKPLIYLDNAASSQKPVQVIEAIDRYYQHTHANVHRGVHTLSQEATDVFESARNTLAAFTGTVDTGEIIFTRGATEAINLVAYTFGLSQLQPGDEIMVSGMEHHSNIVPWQMMCELKGARLTVIPVLEDGSLDIDWYHQHLNAHTRLVAVTHISNALGTINPVKEIINAAHKLQIPVLVDGAQAAPHLAMEVNRLDADFYVFSGHKMYGPTGIGVLYGKRKWLEMLPPWQGGGEMIHEVKWTGTTYNVLPFKYEAGTPDIAGAIGLAAACDYMLSVGFDAIQQHEHHLLMYATKALQQIKGLRLIGTAPQKASVLSFIIDGIHPYDIGTLLDQQGIAVRTGHHCAQPLMDHFDIPGTIRASLAMYSTVEEIDALISGINKAIRILS